MADDNTAKQFEAEYLFLQKTVEDFDGRALTIKAWSVTFSAAGLGFAYQQHNPVLLLVAAGSAVVFWIVEATWKYHQHAFYPRLREIEEWFRAHSSNPKAAPFQLTSSWGTNFVAGRVSPGTRDKMGRLRWLGLPIFPSVSLPHIVVLVAGIVLFFLWPPQTEKSEPPGPSVIYVAR